MNSPATIADISWDQYVCGSIYTRLVMQKIRFGNKKRREVMPVNLGESIKERLKKSGLVGGRAGEE